ncbi:MAG: PP2C family serine/threonine-protein phosphatase [Verrucomicrobiota bacterium]
MRELKDGIRSKVHLDFQGRVHKWFRGTDADKRYQREVDVLKILEERDCPYVPRLLEEHPEDLYFVSTNCGAPANGISRAKSDALFAELERDYGVRHDDPEPRNVTYNSKQGRFNLIDFELAEILKTPSKSKTCQESFTRIRWAAASKRGLKHKANDDFWLALRVDKNGAAPLPPEGESLLKPEDLILAISDGMGGNAAGELASRLVINWIRKHAAELYSSVFADPPLFQKRLRSLLEDAHQGLNEVIARDPSSLKGMGATLTLAYLSSKTLHFAHLGDSRLYLHTNGKTQQLTTDMTYAWKDFHEGKINELQFRQHPRRSALYDVLGGGHPRISPQLGSLPLPADSRLLLCSDGVVDGLWDKHFHQYLSSPEPERIIRDTILQTAYQNSGADDTSLIVAQTSCVGSPSN